MIRQNNFFNNTDNSWITLSGKASLLELKIKLLLSRDGYNINGKSCNKAKKIMYQKYSKYFSDEGKKNIDKATWLRNKLVHFELREILAEQSNISSITREGNLNLNNVLHSIKKFFKKNKAVDKDSFLFAQYFELGKNSERLKLLHDCIDEAIRIVTKIASNNKITIEKYKNNFPNQWREK